MNPNTPERQKKWKQGVEHEPLVLVAELRDLLGHMEFGLEVGCLGCHVKQGDLRTVIDHINEIVKCRP